MKDYKNYSKPQTEPTDEELVKEFEEELKTEEAAEAETEEETVEQQPEPVYGVIHNCAKLNVRKAPSADAEIVCVLNEGTEVRVYEDQSTDEWYNVTHASGVEGFCMKQYIAVLA